MKYIITNGEFYVKRDHARNKYVRDNRKSEATQFTSKQVKHILGLKHKYTWMKDGFYAREIELGKIGKPMESSEIKRKGNGNCFMDWECDNTLIDNIETEERAIVGLLAYDSDQLGEKKFELEQALSYADSARSDILHAIEFKKIDAAKRAVIVGYLKTLQELHRKIKNCIRYIEVMQNCMDNQKDICTLKKELKDAEHKSYVGRTKYYELIQNIIG